MASLFRHDAMRALNDSRGGMPHCRPGERENFVAPDAQKDVQVQLGLSLILGLSALLLFCVRYPHTLGARRLPSTWLTRIL
jgi:hypothetical protein